MNIYSWVCFIGYKRAHLFITKVQLSSLNRVEIDTTGNRRMSDPPHGDVETPAQLILVGSEKDASNMIGTPGQLSALAFQRGL